MSHLHSATLFAETKNANGSSWPYLCANMRKLFISSVHKSQLCCVILQSSQLTLQPTLATLRLCHRIVAPSSRLQSFVCSYIWRRGFGGKLGSKPLLSLLPLGIHFKMQLVLKRSASAGNPRKGSYSVHQFQDF